MRVVSVILLLLAISAPPLFAANPQTAPVFHEGLHYFALPEAVPVELDDKIEVTEIFWYGCSHCFHFEPLVLAWQETMPDDAYFTYVPAMWNAAMEAHARVYYVAQRLGVLEQAHQAIYNAINIDGDRLDNPENVGAFFARFDVNAEDAAAIFDSPEATAFLMSVDAKARAYQISGTPQLIVGGRYRVQSGQQLPRSQMFEVVDYLIEKIRAEQAVSAEHQPSNEEKALL